MTYEEQLKDSRWRELRQHIITRDFGLCGACNGVKNLHVHHIRYFKDRMAWEYEEKYLVTLCGRCHRDLHENFNVPTLDEPDFWMINSNFLSLGIRALREGKIL